MKLEQFILRDFEVAQIPTMMKQNCSSACRRIGIVRTIVFTLCVLLLVQFPARADELHLPLEVARGSGEPIAISNGWFTRFRTWPHTIRDSVVVCFDFVNTGMIPINEVDLLLLFYDGEGHLVKKVAHRRVGHFSPGVAIRSPRNIHERGTWRNCWLTLKADKVFFAVQSAVLIVTRVHFEDGTEWLSSLSQ